VADRICIVDGCSMKHRGLGFCSKHWRRWKRHGTTDDRRPTVRERFWAKVDKNGPVPECLPDLGPCWVWTAFQQRGYGRFRIKEEGISLAHRAAYFLSVGPIPDGMTLDHLCRNTLCVRPDHLEPVTSRENTLRSDGLPATNARKTHCKNGHEFTPENTWVAPGTRKFRLCRTCRAEYSRREEVRARNSERRNTDEYRARHAAYERERMRKKRAELAAS